MLMNRKSILLLLTTVSLMVFNVQRTPAQNRNNEAIQSVQPSMVKVYGEAGVGVLEGYQSGFLISEDGYVLTARSVAVHSDVTEVVTSDGSRFSAVYVGHDPVLEIALLKIEPPGLPYLDLTQFATLGAGDSILAFSNLYGVAIGDESCSVLHGVVAAVTELSARRGIFELPYHGKVYILDAMTNNPGAAGGLITNAKGEIAAVIGKEIRHSQTGSWLNFAIPMSEIIESVDAIRQGRFRPRSASDGRRIAAEPQSPELLGFVLVPDVVANTPPYIDRIVPNSPAESAGLMPDDLILFVEDGLMDSRTQVVEELKYFHRDDPIVITVQRGVQIIEIQLEPGRRDYHP